jgi:hypothetical protein
MSGRAAGFCAGFQMPGFMNPVGGRGGFGMGRGGGRGRGGGFGWRNQFYATGLPGWARSGYGYPFPAAAPNTEQELAGLKQQAEYIQNTLSSVNSRIQQLEDESKSSQ